MVVSILKAEYLGEYTIKLIFSDGVTRVLDFKAFLNNAKNPMTRKFIDKKLFRKFTLEFGDLNWNDYEMCFPIWDLHEGKGFVSK